MTSACEPHIFLCNAVCRTRTMCPAISWTELFWVGLFANFPNDRVHFLFYSGGAHGPILYVLPLIVFGCGINVVQSRVGPRPLFIASDWSACFTGVFWLGDSLRITVFVYVIVFLYVAILRLDSQLWVVITLLSWQLFWDIADIASRVSFLYIRAYMLYKSGVDQFIFVVCKWVRLQVGFVKGQ